MSGGAPLKVIDDETELDGPTIDVGARCGWTLRMARVLSPGAPRLGVVAAALGTNQTRLHRLETGALRHGRLVDAYEQHLALPEGSLRAPIDVLCRTFPGSRRDEDPSSAVDSVRELSALTVDLVAALRSDRHGWAAGASTRKTPRAIDGGTWLRWARTVARLDVAGIPEPIVCDLLAQLVSELGRSIGHGYPARYEALALLRCGPYGHLVIDVARQVVADPHVQVLNDMMSAVGEAVTPDAVTWCLELLADPRDRVVVGAALALENMGHIAPDPAGFWEPLLDPLTELVDGVDTGGTGGVRHEWLSHLLRLVPVSVRREAARAGRGPTRPLAPAARLEDWSRTRLNTHWSDCETRAARVTDRLGLPDQPMLARLLFDIGISPHETRAVTGYMLLGALPAVAGPIGEHLADLAEDHSDPVVRTRAARRLAGARLGTHPARVADRWLEAPHPALRSAAFLLIGSAGHRRATEHLATAIAGGGPIALDALWAAGMAGHPLLALLRTDPALAPELRGAAAWWHDYGRRVAG